MKNKGFTLIELLAVIVILAIIALIAVPVILGVVEKARKGATKSSVLGYIDAVEKQTMINELDTSSSNIIDGVYEIDELDAKNVKVKGKKPSEGWVQIEKGKVSNYSLKVGDYYANPTDGDVSKVSLSKTGEIATKSRGKRRTSGPTIDTTTQYSSANVKQLGLKGVVYLDPTDLNATCSSKNSVSTTETKTGCMKWYIYDDSGANYTMILDHNTTATQAWNSSNSNVAYESSEVKPLVDDLVTTSGWVVTPRLITASEINTITGKTDFDSANRNSWYCLDTNASDTKNYCAKAQGTSKYAWLFDYINTCTSNGCNVADSSNYGYWTSTSVGTAGSSSNVWVVARRGNFGDMNARSTSIGVRPVISVSKSLLN